ncbi:lysyl oxidase family protein [Actinosynnema sp. NPDC047251]|uniref:Lysyl oxidase-like protein n=1 Tax=Saccharothrix espanaensis (strain ATCC 51144 / DSM 44229 / JCM 9112 / NBRC 15066 / NRRL 15764) TaxID=1179773 RepID=K0K9C1_SACES|nr:lysyl oxidase family protein [Saccharothrix espanaensis]CCH33213.1 Lysyl oxidase-like protein [Saccharothrix espanaensis DSM 44229]
MIRKFKAAAAAALTAVVLGAPASEGPLLPDLRQAPVGCPGGFSGNPDKCEAWDVCAVAERYAANGTCLGSGRAAGVRLRFTTSVDNVGDGPLLIYGKRDSTATQTMSARQAFQSAGDRSIPGSYDEARNPIPATMYYEPAPAHTHWHLMDFERFQLRAPDGTTLVLDRKNGFCLGDRYTVRDAADLPSRPRDPDSPEGLLAEFLRENRCRHHEPRALDVVEGISVGAGDDYKYDVDYQWLDLTDVPSGVYDVVNLVNVDRSFLEKDYGNNASSMAISIQWPGGGARPSVITKPPKVQLLRNCPGQERCAQP